MNKPKILVAEDDLVSQKLLHYFLEDYQLDYVKNSRDAIRKIKQESYSCVLVDIALENNDDGLDIPKFIKSTPAVKSIPVIATTAHAFTHDRDRSLEAGCDAFLTKPIMKEKLLQTVQSYVGQATPA
ncbi:MAG: response regulator [Fidelibacterota bacterium]